VDFTDLYFLQIDIFYRFILFTDWYFYKVIFFTNLYFYRCIFLPIQIRNKQCQVICFTQTSRVATGWSECIFWYLHKLPWNIASTYTMQNLLLLHESMKVLIKSTSVPQTRCCVILKEVPFTILWLKTLKKYKSNIESSLLHSELCLFLGSLKTLKFNVHYTYTKIKLI